MVHMLSKQTPVVFILLTVLGLSVSAVVVGAQGAMPVEEFKNLRAMKCTFYISSRASWKNEMPTPEIKKAGLLTIDIKEIDVAAGLAVLGISSGNHDVTLQWDGRNMHFLEANRGGRLSMTTVFADFSTGTRLKAVHSRADYLPIDVGTFKSEPEIAQFYGDCETKLPPPQ